MLTKDEKERVKVTMNFLESFDNLLNAFTSRQEKFVENCFLAPDSDCYWNVVMETVPTIESEVVLAQLLHEKIVEQYILLSELKGE